MKFGKLNLKKGSKTNQEDQDIVEDLDPLDEPGSKASLFDRLKESKREDGRGSSFQEASSDIRLNAFTLSFGKIDTAVNVTWVMVQPGDKPKDIADEVTSRTTAEGRSDLDEAAGPDQAFNLYTTIDGGEFIGVSSNDAGHKNGMKVLITMINLRKAGRSWAGAFLVNKQRDTWWVGAMRNGEILEDRLTRSAHVARDLMSNFLDVPDLESVFAPDEWGISGSNPAPLNTIVNIKAGDTLRNVSPLKANMPRILVGASVLAVAVAGAYFVYEMKAHEQQRLADLQKEMASRVILRDNEKPWYHSPSIEQTIRACEEQVEKGVILIPGWTPQPISCTISQNGKGVVVTGWNVQAGGKSSWLRAAFTPELPQPVFNKDAKSADWTLPFISDFDENSQNHEPWKENKIYSWISERFQNAGVAIDMRASSTNRSSATKKPQFNSVEIRVSSDVSLQKYVDMLKDIPALVPTTMIYNPTKGSWDLVAKIYEPVIMPKSKR